MKSYLLFTSDTPPLDTKKFVVNLTTANKYMTCLETHQSSRNKTDVDTYGSHQHSGKHAQDPVMIRRRVSWDITQIKNAIVRTNCVYNIDTVSSRIDHLTVLKTEHMQTLKGMNKPVGNDDDLRMLDAWSRSELQEEITQINRKIKDLETERNHLNATAKVALVLSPASIEIIGI